MTLSIFQSCTDCPQRRPITPSNDEASFRQFQVVRKAKFSVFLLIACSQSISGFSLATPKRLVAESSHIPRYFRHTDGIVVTDDDTIASGAAWGYFNISQSQQYISTQLPILENADTIAFGEAILSPWQTHLDGPQAERKLSELRNAMKVASSLSSEEAEDVESAIRFAARGDLDKVAGAADFCHVMLETIEADAATLIAGSFHYCSCLTIREEEVTGLRNISNKKVVLEEFLRIESLSHPALANEVKLIAEDSLQLKQIELDYESIITDSKSNSSTLTPGVSPNSAGNLRMLLLAASKNWRGLAIRTSACLYRLRGIVRSLNDDNFTTGAAETRVAREALHIFVPLASQLGMNRLKNEIEGSAFRILYRRQFETVNSLMKQPKQKSKISMLHGIDSSPGDESGPFTSLKDDMDKVLSHSVEEVRKLLRDDSSFSNLIDNMTVTARVKEPYSLWKKMLRLGSKSILDVPDALALRIVVDANKMDKSENVSEVEHEEIVQSMDRLVCYFAHKLCSQSFKPLNKGRFKDYIANPKPNGYQSLHYTACITHENEEWPIEIQIRSSEMHQVAEFGLASHWHYKFQSNNKSSGNLNKKFQLDHSTAAYLSACEEWQWQHAQNDAKTWSKKSELPSQVINEDVNKRNQLDDRNPFIKALEVTQSKLTRERVFVFLTSQQIGADLRNGKLLELPAGACVLDALRETEQTLGFSTRLRDHSLLAGIVHNDSSLISLTQKLRNGDVLTIPVCSKPVCP